MHSYSKDPDDLRSLVISRGRDTHVHICVDAQTGLVTRPPRPHSANIGTATTVSNRVEKLRMLDNLIMEHMLTATDTFYFEEDGTTNIFTCNYNGHTSHNRLITSFLQTPVCAPRRLTHLSLPLPNSHAKVNRKKMVRKPIGWQCCDHVSYNSEVRARANMKTDSFAQASHHVEEHLYVFTDGSARKVTCAGWGFIAMKCYRNGQGVPMVTVCGPVQMDEGGDFWVGATRATNNTSEMQALIEALYWLNSCVEDKKLPYYSKVMITVDSLCVKGLIDEEFVARENRAIAMRLCHMWKSGEEDIESEYTLGTRALWRRGQHYRGRARGHGDTS